MKNIQLLFIFIFELLIIIVGGCKDKSCNIVTNNQFSSFVMNNDTHTCTCLDTMNYLIYGEMGLVANCLTTADDHKWMQIKSHLQSFAGKESFKILSLDACIEEIHNQLEGPTPMRVLVHESGHLYGLFGTVKINNILMFQLIHGALQSFMISENDIKNSNFIEVWYFNKLNKYLEFTVGNSQLGIDRIVHNFEEVKPFQELTCSFFVKNCGLNTLILKKPVSSCICVVLEMPQIKELRPDESYEIKILFRTSQRVIGYQELIVEVFEKNTSAHNCIPLILLSTQRDTLKISPKSMTLYESKSLSCLSETFFLHEVPSDLFSIKYIDSDLCEFKYNIDTQKKSNHLNSYRVSFNCSAEKNTNKKNKCIKVYTTSNFVPLIVIPVNIESRPDIVLKPKSLSFGAINKNTPTTRTLSLKSDNKLSFVRITAPECVLCSYRKIMNNEYEIDVTFKPKETGIWNDSITVQIYKGGIDEALTIKLAAFVKEPKN